MDEANVFWLHKKVPKPRTKQKPKERKKKYKDRLSVKVSSLRRRGISIGVILRWLSGGIVFHIDVLGASLKKRAGNSS